MRAKKTLFITGVSSGFGQALAREALLCGHRVVGTVRSVAAVREFEALDPAGAHARVLDVTDTASIDALVAEVESRFGPVDVLVNNAGIETIVPFLELTDQQWSDVVDVDLRGEWICCQVFCRLAVAAGRPGSIINIGSIQAGKILPGRTHYAPAKLAIEALTRNISAEMGALGIRVNCIHPGLIETPMVDWVLKHPDPTVLPGVVAQISLGRTGQPREIGTVAAFFASEEARYVTGQSIYVDGGWVGK